MSCSGRTSLGESYLSLILRHIDPSVLFGCFGVFVQCGCVGSQKGLQHWYSWEWWSEWLSLEADSWWGGSLSIVAAKPKTVGAIFCQARRARVGLQRRFFNNNTSRNVWTSNLGAYSVISVMMGKAF